MMVTNVCVSVFSLLYRVVMVDCLFNVERVFGFDLVCLRVWLVGWCVEG